MGKKDRPMQMLDMNRYTVETKYGLMSYQYPLEVNLRCEVCAP